MIKNKVIITPNYKIGIEIALYLKESSKTIYVNRKKIEYKRDQKIYELIEEEEEILESILINLEPNICKTPNILRINNIIDLINEAKQYKYIAPSEELKSIFKESFGYVESQKYCESKEGKRWLILHELMITKMCDLTTLKTLDAYNKNKIWQDEFCDYVEFDLNMNIENMYEEIFQKKPNYIVKTINNKFYELINIEIQEKESMIVDKSLLKYIEEDVLYIGQTEYEGAKNQIIYDPKFVGYTEFEKKNLEVNPKGYYQEKEYANGNISRVYAMQKGLSSNEYNFYAKYKKYLKELIYKICIKKEDINWKNKFKLDHEFYKLLVKTENILNQFELFQKEKEVKNLKQNAYYNEVKWDFYSLENQIAIDISTSKFSLKDLYAKKKYCTTNYYIITENEFLLIENYEELEEKIKTEHIFEDDLTYWNN